MICRTPQCIAPHVIHIRHIRHTSREIHFSYVFQGLRIFLLGGVAALAQCVRRGCPWMVWQTSSTQVQFHQATECSKNYTACVYIIGVED